MAELAGGAVRSLLGVIRNEAQLLGRVEGDVQFIKEEMESMNSFLLHLARTTPPGGEHDEQVRTWMKQVRELAHDCSNCIDLYLRRGDPAVYRARGRLLGYVWWVPWFVQKVLAQHDAATQLGELKDRARDVGERRLRYGVEVPAKSGAGKTSALAPPITGATQASGVGDPEEEEDDDDEEEEEEEEDDDSQAMNVSATRELLASSEAARVLEECCEKLVTRLLSFRSQDNDRFEAIVIAAPDSEDGADVARKALARPSVATKFEHEFWITCPWYRLVSPSYILSEILEQLPEPEQMSSTPGTVIQEIEDREPKIEELEYKIKEIKGKMGEHLREAGTKKPPLDILRDILQEHGSVKEDKEDKSDEDKIQETVEKIKHHLESGVRGSWVGLDHPDYASILRELLPQPKEDKPVKKKATDKLGGDNEIAKNIKEITNKLKVDILRELVPKAQEDRSVKGDADGSVEDHIEEKIKETTEKIIVNMLQEKMLPKPKEDTDTLEEDQRIEEISWTIRYKIEEALKSIEEHLLIKEKAEQIKKHQLEGKRTIIVFDGVSSEYRWKEIEWTLSKLGCATGSTVIMTTKYNDVANKLRSQANAFGPIEYSLVSFYHTEVINLTSKLKYKDDKYNARAYRDKYNTNIYRDILKLCDPDEFCMKLFVHALFTNPNRSNKELEKLKGTLVSIESFDTIAKKIIKFSYNGLHRDYKTCLLYLAIFRPSPQKINRSSLVGRWVVEGLITREDWPSSVRQAERCFDTLVHGLLVHPGDISATGKVKSCKLHPRVHEVITKIARKEHFVETRLSHHLARHFSVLSDIQLRRSESMEKFLRKLYKSPQLPLVKVLDLEGCQQNIFNQLFKKRLQSHYLMKIYNQHFEKNQHRHGLMNICKHLEKNQHRHYLKNICDKMLLLKYLSLRNTDITTLPKEINNLHQLEVLDIRQTGITASATKDVLLLKLKRLLAGCIHPSPISVSIPRGIEKMRNMEVLSNVEAWRVGDDLKDIGKLWQLRKLGVVINDKKNRLMNFLRAISDLNECLQSLSITMSKSEGQASNRALPEDICYHLKNHPKLLESLSINGFTRRGQLLPLLVEDGNLLAKVTLHNTFLNQDNLKELAKLPKLRCVRLRHKAYSENELTFNENEFPNLKFLVIECADITSIKFNGGAPNLEKIAWSFTNMESLSGITGLTELQEIELNGDHVPDVTLKELAKLPKLRCVRLRHKAYSEKELTFNENEFPNLKLLVIECADITSINFNGGAPNLEKIAWSFTNMESLSGIDKLSNLQELELNGDKIPYVVRKDIKEHPKRPVLKHNPPEQEGQGPTTTRASAAT